MIPFEEIDSRLEKLGKDRKWLATTIRRSADAINAALAPNSAPHKKSDAIRGLMTDAIEREETDQANARALDPIDALRQHAITVYPTREQFNRWSQAFKSSDAVNLEEWAEKGLDALAAEWSETKEPGKIPTVPLASVPAPEVPDNIITFPEIPLHHAAAGSPITSDGDTFAPMKKYGPGRFAVKLHGDSMAPNYPNGSTVILREKNSLTRPVLKKGQIYLFSIDGQKTLKIYDTRPATASDIEEGTAYTGSDGKPKVRILRSLNPEFPCICLNESDAADWLGWLDPKDN